jgi:anti-anti-sigma factor
MVIDIEERDGICIILPKGRLVVSTDWEYLRSKSDEIRNRNHRKVLADLAEVDYIDSTVISFLVGIYTSVTARSNGRFVLSGANHRVRHILDLTRLSSVIQIAGDRESGMAILLAETASA